MKNDICPVCGFDAAADVLAHPTLSGTIKTNLRLYEKCARLPSNDVEFPDYHKGRGVKKPKKSKKAWKIAVPALCVAAAAAVALLLILAKSPPASSDNKAVQAADNTAQAADDAVPQELRGVSVGDHVFFGAYEQDNDASNGKEPIEWRVLDVEDGKALLISEYALDAKCYNDTFGDTNWETCTLRQWLNSDFLNAAFSAQEQASIPVTAIAADHREYYADPGNDTQDRIFLLTIDEVSKYFSSDDDRQCTPTAYALANGATGNISNDKCYWWLRSPGESQDYATYVIYDGSIYNLGFFADLAESVRPAMWVNIGS